MRARTQKNRVCAPDYPAFERMKCVPVVNRYLRGTVAIKFGGLPVFRGLLLDKEASKQCRLRLFKGWITLSYWINL